LTYERSHGWASRAFRSFVWTLSGWRKRRKVAKGLEGLGAEAGEGQVGSEEGPCTQEGYVYRRLVLPVPAGRLDALSSALSSAEKKDEAEARAAIKLQIEADNKAGAEQTALEKSIRDGGVIDVVTGQPTHAAKSPEEQKVDDGAYCT
jgi:primosomal replication protein N